MKVRWCELKDFIVNLLRGVGLSEKNAKIMADVVIRATARGVGHHDVHDLPWRLEEISKGNINPNPRIELLNKYKALESYRGDNGPGEICCSFIMERAKRLADEYGIGLCTICDSNHYLASAPYVEKAAEEGYLAILFTRGLPVMGAPSRKEHVISSCPMGFAAASTKDYPIVHDICLAYASYGTLNKKVKKGECVPIHWGVDKDGRPTSDPKALIDGTIWPIGQHKGFGLAILGEILTGILSGGQVIDEPNPETGKVGVASQTAIVLRPDKLMGSKVFETKVTELIDRMEARAPGLHIPGQNSYKNKKQIEEEDSVFIEDSVFEELNMWADKLNIARLAYIR